MCVSRQRTTPRNKKRLARSGSRSKARGTEPIQTRQALRHAGTGAVPKACAELYTISCITIKNVEHKLSKRLREALEPAEWELLQRVSDAARELHLPLYVVGGVPRDLLLGQPVGDLDLVVEGDAQALARLLRNKYGGKITMHGKFGTAKWQPTATGV